MLCIASMGLVMSCSKEETIRDKVIGNWQTENVTFNYYELGDISINAWGRYSDVPSRLILKEDGSFSMNAKSQSCTGKWTINEVEYEGEEFKGTIFLEYENGQHPYYEAIDVLNYWDDMLKLSVCASVDAGAVDYYGRSIVTYPIATFKMKRL